MFRVLSNQHYQHRTNQKLRSWANVVLQNRGVCGRAFPSLPSPVIPFFCTRVSDDRKYVCSRRLYAQWPPFVYKIRQKPRGVLPEKLGGGVRHASWNPYPFSDQDLWFSVPDQIFDTLFQTWSPGARCVTGARDKLLRHVHGWRKQ